MSKFNLKNNFGLPRELPDYEDIEAILEQMAIDENIIRQEYNSEKTQIANLRRHRQVLENSNIPKNSKTYINQDAKIRFLEKKLSDKYKRARQPQNALLNKFYPAFPRYKVPSEQLKPTIPNYKTKYEQFKPVVAPKQRELSKYSYNDYENIAGWLLAAGGIAIVSWGGFNLFLAKSFKSETTQTVKLKQLGQEIKSLKMTLAPYYSQYLFSSSAHVNPSNKDNSAMSMIEKLKPRIEKLESEFYPLFNTVCRSPNYRDPLGLINMHTDVENTINDLCK